MAARSSVARGTILGFLAQAWQLITVFVLLHFAWFKLGAAGFGQWRVVVSVLLYIEMLVDTGLVQVTSKRLAEDPDNAPLVERAAYLGQAVLAVALFVVALVLAGPIAAGLRDDSLATLIRISALDIPVVAAFMIGGAVLLGKHQFGRQALGMTVYATAKFVLIGALVWIGFSVPGALVGNALSSLVGSAVVVTLWDKSDVAFGRITSEAWVMGLAAIPFLVLSLIGGVASSADLWFVQALKGANVVGPYASAALLAEIPTFLFAGLSRALFPSIAAADANDDLKTLAHMATQGVRLALLVTILGVAAIAATGAEALRFVYGPAAAAAAVPFAVLMVASVGRTVRGACADVLMGRGLRRWVLIVVAGAVIAEVALLVFATPAYGTLGAAWSAAVASLAAGVAAVLTARDLFRGRILLTLVRSSLAAGVVWYLLRLAHPAGVWLLVAYAIASAVYAAVLFVTGEVDKRDIASLRMAAGR